jgi:hypothetical protein
LLIPVIGLIHLTQIIVREMKKQNSGVSAEILHSSVRHD